MKSRQDSPTGQEQERESMRRLKDVQMELTADEVQQILSIALDEDRDRAVEFIRDHLARKVDKKLQERWVPVFEVSYGPGQIGQFS